VVVTSSLNVTATEVGRALVVELLVEVVDFDVLDVVVVPFVVVEPPPVIGVWLEGQDPVEAVL
jgi:hypothetical protein